MSSIEYEFCEVFGVPLGFNADRFFALHQLISKEKFILYTSGTKFYKVDSNNKASSVDINPLTNTEIHLSSLDMESVYLVSKPFCCIRRKIYKVHNDKVIFDQITYFPYNDPHATITVYSNQTISSHLNLSRSNLIEYTIRHKPAEFIHKYMDLNQKYEFRSPSLMSKQYEKFKKMYDTKTLFELMELIQGKAILKQNFTPPDLSF